MTVQDVPVHDMTLHDLAAHRLRNQRLVGPPLDGPAEVVRWLGAVQAQDYPGAAWGVGQRTAGATRADVDRLFDAGAFIRTHVMRPTWHLVAPEDLRGLLALTAPRVHAANGTMYRRLELDAGVLARAHDLLAAALRDRRPRTRAELRVALAEGGLAAEGQRLAYVLMHAELEGLVCSGPLRGRQFTYALVEERVPPASPLARDEARDRLVRRYLASHGPATPHDFAWWSGLTVTDARAAFAALGADAERGAVDGKPYWTTGPVEPAPVEAPVVRLLPNYDEHVVAYRDHGPTLDPRAPGVLDGFGTALVAHLVARNGLLVGGWRRRESRTTVGVEAALLVPFDAAERRALEAEAERYGRFMGRPVTLDVG